MSSMISVPIGPYVCGLGRPLLFILGPCVIESHDLTLHIAETLAALRDRLNLSVIFREAG